MVMNDGKTIVYLIRHCEAEGNIKEIFQGHSDGDITDKGLEQLELLSFRFGEIPVDIIYSSPLLRAYKTALAVGKINSVPIIKEEGIMEINGGEMEGKKWLELPVLFPDIYLNWKNDFPSFKAPGGESIRDVYDRMKLTILKRISENIGKSIAFVSHGGAIYTFLSYAFGIPFDSIHGKNFWCENTSISRIDFYTENDLLKPNVIYINDFNHLDSKTKPHQMFWRKSDEMIK